MYFGFSVFLTAVLVHRLGGLLLLVLVAVPARIGSGSVKVTAFELAIPLCLFIELRRGLAQERKQPVPPNLVTVPVLGFYLLSLASGYWALDGHLWLNRVVVLSEALAAGWIVYLATSRLGTQAFVRLVVWSTTGGAAWALIWFYVLGRPLALNIQPPTGPDATLAQLLRLGSPLLGPSNYYAGFLLLSIPVTFYLCRKTSNYWLCLFVQLGAFFGTLSRGGSLALLSAAVIVLAIRQVLVRKIPHGLTVVAVGLVAFALSPFVPVVLHSLLAQRRETTFAGNGYQARADLWDVALDLWRSHPYVGIGAGTWDAAVSATYTGQAHNVVLQILAELGMFGLLFAAFALCAILAITWRIPDLRLRLCFLAAILGSLVSCLSEATFEGAVFTWFLGAFLGGVLATSTKKQVAV